MKKAPQKTICLATYAKVEVEADYPLQDVLDEIDSEDMIEELQRRGDLPTTVQKGTTSVMDVMVLEILSEAAKRFTLAELQERLR